MYAIAFFTFVFKIVFAFQHWGALHSALMPWLYAAVSIPVTFVVVIVFVVRPGILSNYTIWKRREGTLNRPRDEATKNHWEKARWLDWWKSGLTIRWGNFGISPEFSFRLIEWVDWHGIKRPVSHSRSEYGTEQRDLSRPSYYTDPDWSKDEVEYVLIYRRWSWKDAVRVNWTPIMRVLWGWGWMTLVIFAIVGFILGPLPWLAGFFVPKATTAPALTATQVAVSTNAPRPTATPVQVEVTTEGYALVVELDRDVPPSEFWRRVNEALSVSCDICTALPTIPIPDWVWNIIGDWEFTIVRLPRGMEGYIVAYQTPYGMDVQRVDDHFQPIGNAEPLAETEVTITARDRRFGIGYDRKGWDLPINGYRGDALVTVTESSNLPLIVEARGLAYNFRWWHLLILIAVIIIGGVVVYRKIYY